MLAQSSEQVISMIGYQRVSNKDQAHSGLGPEPRLDISLHYFYAHG
jgi:hypothetical protein